MIILYFALLFLGIILESFLFTIPFVLLILIPVSVIVRNNSVLLLAFISGILLDLLTFQMIGKSSIFFVTAVFLIFSYEKKFETNTSYFVAAASLAGSFLFLIYSGHKNILLTTIISTVLALVVFNIFKFLQRSKNKNSSQLEYQI